MMYSKHAASVGASDQAMANTITGRANHRLLDQQGLPKPFGALGETLPHKLGTGASNIPPNFHRRTLGDNGGMLAYTEHVNAVNQRRYQYNFPQGQGQGQIGQGQVGQIGQGQYGTQATKPSNGSSGRKWASLPKLHYKRDPSAKDEPSVYFKSKEFKRPQSDIVMHEPLSRPNTPVRPASDSTSHEPLPSVSPRIRMHDYRDYFAGTHGPNVLSLTEEEEAANAFYDDDFETEDSGVEPELKDIRETPVESALKDLNQPNRNIEITPFPGIVELSSQPAVIHTPSKLKSPQHSRHIVDNATWTKKGKTRTVKVTVNNDRHNNIKILPDYPLTTVASDSKKVDVPQKSMVSPRRPRHYMKQASESANHSDLLDRSVSPELNLNEVIIPGIEEELPVEEVPVKAQLPIVIPKHYPVTKEARSSNQNSPNQSQTMQTQSNFQPAREANGLAKVPPVSVATLQKAKDTIPKAPTVSTSKSEKAKDSIPKAQPTSTTKSEKSKDSPKASPVSPTKTEKSKDSPKASPSQVSPTKSEKSKGQSSGTSKAFVKTDSMDELPDIAVTGSKVSSKPVSPTKDTKPKKTSATKTSTPVQKPSKPPTIRIPTASSKTVTKETKDTESKNSAPSKDSGGKVTKKTKPKKAEDAKELEEEDSVPELRGVLKARGDGTKKGKKKSVQFGPKFVREVTKITYPWNEVSSSDSDSGEDSDEDDFDESDIEELIDEETETLISRDKNGTNRDEIDAVNGENKVDSP